MQQKRGTEYACQHVPAIPTPRGEWELCFKAHCVAGAKQTASLGRAPRMGRNKWHEKLEGVGAGV